MPRLSIAPFFGRVLVQNTANKPSEGGDHVSRCHHVAMRVFGKVIVANGGRSHYRIGSRQSSTLDISSSTFKPKLQTWSTPESPSHVA
ncbi:hypothetical protein LA080_007196 [Diaporthe eres]|nr:hypothetical protein LA080_007196 [Diaporthe eres]